MITTDLTSDGRPRARFAFEIARAGIRGADPGALTSRLLHRQLQLLNGLTDLGGHASLELRLESVADERNASRVRLLIIGAAEGFDAKDAHAKAETFRGDLLQLFPSELDFYALDQVADPSETLAWPATGAFVSEVVRREELLPLESASAVYAVHPYPPHGNTFAALFHQLSRAKFRTSISIIVRPARLLPFESDYLHDSLSLLDGTPTASRSFARGEAEAVRATIREQILEGRNLLLLRSFVASSEPIPAGLLAVVGSEFVQQSTSLRAHGFSVRRGDDPAECERLRNDLRDHAFRPVAPALAPRRLQRLLYLFDPLEALSVFRLPLPNHDGRVGTLPFPEMRTTPATLDGAREGVLIGENVHHGLTTPIRLAEDDFGRHLYIIGQTGTGKSTLLRELIVQDIRAGRGVGVIDPHGDLVESLLAEIPPERADELVYLNPMDDEYPIGVNLFGADDAHEREFLINEAVSIFLRLFGPEMFGPRIQDYFRNFALTLMQSEGGGALTDLVPLLVDNDFQQERRRGIKDPLLLQFWKQFDATRDYDQREMIPYFAAKFSPFYSERLMRLMFGQVRPKIRVSDAMERGMILLVNLAKGMIGEENSRLIGMSMMAQVQTAAMRRARQARSERRPFHLYVDEFHNYASSGFSTLLAEGRKFGLSLVLANQFTSQLRYGTWARMAESAFDGVVGNVGNIMVFRVGADDADPLARLLGLRYRPEELAALPNFHAVARLLDRGQVGEAISVRTQATPPTFGPEIVEQMKQRSRLAFGVNATEVEDAIRGRLGIDSSNDEE